MSFGYSVTDIIVVFHSIIKFHDKLKRAGSEFVELSDYADRLRCTLEPLSRRKAEMYFGKLGAQDAAEMQQNLNATVKNCARTLEALQKILDKYKKYLADRSTATVPQPQDRIRIIRRDLAKILMKLKWLREGNELNRLRGKLQDNKGEIDSILNAST
jgi:hypothetical protein